jgi:hypothetical protein
MLGSLIRSRVFFAYATGSGFVLLLLVAAIALTRGDNDTSASASPTPTATLDASTTGSPGDGSGDRLVIAGAKVDAPISLKTVPLEGGDLPTPDGPDEVALYDFAAHPGFGGRPGAGGRIVLGGHVDYAQGPCQDGSIPPPCRAVFWDLSDLDPDDVIELRFADGVHRYRVTASDNIAATDQDKWDQVWTSTPQETIALVTCGGDFNRQTREYASRHVVYGERLAD